MSTILKALKKLEERKASQGRRQGDIAWDILREPPQPATRGGVSLRAGLGALLLVVAVAACVWYLLADRRQPGPFGIPVSESGAATSARLVSAPPAADASEVNRCAAQLHHKSGRAAARNDTGNGNLYRQRDRLSRS